jgi:DNA end-binding protein Ku
MRTIWNGSISFGLVNIPVGLALATAPKARQSDVSFRTLHRECQTPIRNKRWCPTHDREVGADEIVKGWEVAKGEFVIVEDADLEAIERNDDSRSIDINRFVKLGEVDPVYLDRTYYLAPATAPAQRRPYVLLLEAMRQAEMGAIGRFVLRGAEYFCLIRPKGDALALETLFLAEDVRSQVEIEEAVEGTEVKEAELSLASQVMDSLVGEFDPSELHSEYRQDLRAMLEAKLSGQEVAKPKPAPEETPVVDLMEALKRSVAEAQDRKTTAPAAASKKRGTAKAGSSKARRTPARKSA